MQSVQCVCVCVRVCVCVCVCVCVFYLPVCGRGHPFGGGELEGVHDPQDLVEVASGGGGVEQGQLQPLVRTDDEHLQAGSAHRVSTDPYSKPVVRSHQTKASSSGTTTAVCCASVTPVK